jgi:Sulfatase-modifying factor enzyme 1
MVDAERLTTTRSNLADVVRLWTHALRLQPDCDAPPADWVRVLGYEAVEPDLPVLTLSVPAKRIVPGSDEVPSFDEASSPRVMPSPDVALPADTPQPTGTMQRTDTRQRTDSTQRTDATRSQPTLHVRNTPRLRASILAVVAADFERVSELLTEEERLEVLSPLAPEDYEPLHRGMTTPWQPLAPRSRWWPALRQFTPQLRAGTDMSRLVRDFARVWQSRRLPQLLRRGHFHRLLVFRDARKCMHPYARDFRVAWAQLCAQPQASGQQMKPFHGLPPPVPDGVDAVLLLSDLGLSSAAGIADEWVAWARGMAVRGVAVQAWLPVSAQAVPSALARVLPCMPWHERSTFRICRGSTRRGVGNSGAVSEEFLMAKFWPQLAIAQCIEPALLRRVRLLVGGQARPEWESMLWRESAQHLAGEQVIQLRPERVTAWRHAFATLSPQLQLQIWHTFTAQHAHLPRSTLAMERLIWAAYAAPAAVAQVELELAQAEDWLRRLAAQEAVNSNAHWQAAQAGQEHALHAAFLHGLVLRNRLDPVFTRDYSKQYAPLAVAVGRMGQGVGVADQDWLQALPSTLQEVDQLPWSLQLHHGSHGVFIEKWVNRSLPDELLSSQTPQLLQLLPQAIRSSAIWHAYGHIPQLLGLKHSACPGELCFHDEQGIHRLQLDNLRRASWQHALGCDSYGVFCEVDIKDIRLRFRYIPPGTFLQGSPEGIGGKDEHPQHPVTLSQGLWLAETPCTQALWLSVMGKNPSYFKQQGDTHRQPLEEVSWDDAQTFLAALLSLLPPGCEAVLPTESQWEFACRAGTQTEYWWGDAPDDAQANWNEQHKGTTPVDRYPPNPWGLRDMHGNVWEWCADGKRDYTGEPAWDPEGPRDDDARVVRGGSWFFLPGDSRAGFRGLGHCGHTTLHQGFRFALRSACGLEVSAAESARRAMQVEGE